MKLPDLLDRLRPPSGTDGGAKRSNSRWLWGTLALLLLLFLLGLDHVAPDGSGRHLTLNQVRAAIAQQRVTDATLHDQDARLVGHLTDGPAPVGPEAGTKGPSDALPSTGGAFWTAVPSNGAVTAAVIDSLQGAGVRFEVDGQTTKQKVKTTTTFLLPLLIFANLLALLMTSQGSGSAIADVMTFGSLGQKRMKPGESPTVTFDQVAGCDEAVAELAEVRDYLRSPARYQAVGASPPKGVLLFGPPGCGKTLLAKAVAGESGVAFFSVTGAEFVESLVGVGAARVRDLFARVRAAAPAILFIDELDAAARRRGAGGGTGGADEREQTLNQLLVEMDGFSVSSGIVVIAATNRPDIIDPALMRPGRFDRHITVEAPDAVGRASILRLHAKGKPLESGVDVADMARRTPGFTGADLANVVNEAAILAARERTPRLSQHHLDEALARMLHGPQRRGRIISPDERRRLAVHESGHAVLAAATGRLDDVHRVSILTGGRKLAAVSLSSDDDAAVLTRSRLMDRLAMTLAGRAAETLVLGEPSTGAVDDLEDATNLARDIAGRYGMSDALGAARLLASDSEIYLGETGGLASVSEETHKALDREVQRLLADAERHAASVLRANRRALERLTAAVLEHESLDGDALPGILGTITLAEKANGTKAAAKRGA